MSSADLLSARRRSVPANLSISYAEAGGLHIVRGAGAYLYDAHGRCYLDAVNNVAHVGHSNKLVNQRLQDQQSRVNTNTRYLSTTLSTYTSRLLAHCPTPLSDGKCFLVASGSEANDLAMRLCRAHAHARRGKQEQRPSDTSTDIFICLAFGYHGATNSVIDISPYKYRSKGGRGRARHIIEVDVLAEGFDEAKQQHELKALQAAIDQALAAGHSICGFFAESVLSCAGQVFLPPSFMQALYRIVRAAGGLCVADEVQTGFGRLGCWWGFETLGVVPDIVTTGKPIGNGYPMAAVVCTEAVATAFHNGMEYFNSCAGTNTAAAVGIAVLDCIEQQRLVDHADTVGRLLLLHLRELAVGFPWISGVRGQGLFLGVDIETGRSSARAASSSSKRSASFRITLRQLPPKLPECRCAEGASLPPSPACPLDSGSVCSWLCTALMLCSPMGILAGTDGPRHNVLKLKPPMVFDERDAEYCVQGLQACLEAFQRLHPCTQAVAPRELPSKL